MSGMEIMLKSMGLGEVMDMAKGLATDGTLQKIMAFAEGVDELNARLERIEKLVREIHGTAPEEQKTYPASDYRSTDDGAKPGSSSKRYGGPELLAVDGAGMSGEPRAA